MLAANVIYTRPFQESIRGDLSFNPLDHKHISSFSEIAQWWEHMDVWISIGPNFYMQSKNISPKLTSFLSAKPATYSWLT